MGLVASYLRELRAYPTHAATRGVVAGVPGEQPRQRRGGDYVAVREGQPDVRIKRPG